VTVTWPERAAVRRLVAIGVSTVGLLACASADDPPRTVDTTTSTTGAPEPEPDSYEVATIDGELFDATRDRRIPYRAFAPVGAEGQTPVILVSHGGTGSDNAYTRGGHLGRTFAAGGFLTIHVGHVESTGSSRTVVDRPADITFVLDELDAGTVELPAGFGAEPDLTRVGHAGHSFGAYTSHAVGGATFDTPGAASFADARIDAIGPISPQGPGQMGAFDRGPTDNTWMSVTIPAYNLIGGEEVDTNAVSTIELPGWRLEPFRHYPAEGDKFVTTIEGQDHADMWATGSDEVLSFIAEELLAFFRHYVAGDPSVDACAIGSGDPGVPITTERLASTIDSSIADCPG
jgi:pimeloyl-ACP methyl ester carboxylesterase